MEPLEGVEPSETGFGGQCNIRVASGAERLVRPEGLAPSPHGLKDRQATLPHGLMEPPAGVQPAHPRLQDAVMRGIGGTKEAPGAESNRPSTSRGFSRNRTAVLRASLKPFPPPCYPDWALRPAGARHQTTAIDVVPKLGAAPSPARLQRAASTELASSASWSRKWESNPRLTLTKRLGLRDLSGGNGGSRQSSASRLASSIQPRGLPRASVAPLLPSACGFEPQVLVHPQGLAP